MIADPVLVQKFGGTSVATPERRLRVVEHVRSAQAAGFSVVVVVSAMGRRGDPYATDTLLGLLQPDVGTVDPRAYDLMFTSGEAISAAVLAHDLRVAGIPAVPMTGAQAGIYTDGRHREAEIVTIDTAHLVCAMVRGDVPVITGAQGVAPGTLEFTTLGRGGSDTSGVAVGAALHADRVEIFTDVEGVAIADPRIIPEATFRNQVSYAAMYELARFGATVLHHRAVAVARDCHVPLVVRSTFSDAPGTLIYDVPDEGPIVGFAALPSMTTVVLTPGAVDAQTRKDWEHDGLLSLIDRSSGALVVGARSRRPEDVEALVARSSAPCGRAVGGLAWVTVVGSSPILGQTYGEGAESLSKVGIEVLWDEATLRRHTWVVRDETRERTVVELYRRAAGRTGAPSGAGRSPQVDLARRRATHSSPAFRRGR